MSTPGPEDRIDDLLGTATAIKAGLPGMRPGRLAELIAAELLRRPSAPRAIATYHWYCAHGRQVDRRTRN